MTLTDSERRSESVVKREPEASTRAKMYTPTSDPRQPLYRKMTFRPCRWRASLFSLAPAHGVIRERNLTQLGLLPDHDPLV